MDILILLMGLTLISAGWVLIWEFTRFLHCAYAVQGRVVFLEPGYSRNKRNGDGHKIYFFPVIEYRWQGKNIRFTSLDENCISSLQVGDQVQLSFSRSRRKHTRFGRFVTLMMSLMAILIAGVLSGAHILGEEVALTDIFLASSILAICLFIIVLYLRQQDETAVDSLHHTRRRSVLNCVFLQEPTNVCYWKDLFTNRSQRRRIWVSKMLGSSCLVTGLALFISAFNLGGAVSSDTVHLDEASQLVTTPQNVVQKAIIRN